MDQLTLWSKEEMKAMEAKPVEAPLLFPMLERTHYTFTEWLVKNKAETLLLRNYTMDDAVTLYTSLCIREEYLWRRWVDGR